MKIKRLHQLKFINSFNNKKAYSVNLVRIFKVSINYKSDKCNSGISRFVDCTLEWFQRNQFGIPLRHVSAIKCIMFSPGMLTYFGGPRLAHGMANGWSRVQIT